MYEAIERYLALHRRLHEELPSLAPGSSAAELSNVPEGLARAIERARPNARQGDFFSARPARVIKHRVDVVLHDPAMIAVLANIDDEPPSIGTPKIYLRFPASNQMARMPANLLATLPALPPELEYRIVGHYLVLRDTRASIIVDYIAQVVPVR